MHDGPRPLFGVGYQGRDVGQLVAALLAARVETVVDVRLNPISRRPGFSKGPLSAALSDVGIGYVHERTLGNPPENRAAFASRDRARAHQALRARLTGEGAAAMERLVALTARQRVAVLCLERDRTECHRAVILERARGLDPRIAVRDIG